MLRLYLQCEPRSTIAAFPSALSMRTCMYMMHQRKSICSRLCSQLMQAVSSKQRSCAVAKCRAWHRFFRLCCCCIFAHKRHVLDSVRSQAQLSHAAANGCSEAVLLGKLSTACIMTAFHTCTWCMSSNQHYSMQAGVGALCATADSTACRRPLAAVPAWPPQKLGRRTSAAPFDCNRLHSAAVAAWSHSSVCRKTRAQQPAPRRG